MVSILGARLRAAARIRAPTASRRTSSLSGLGNEALAISVFSPRGGSAVDGSMPIRMLNNARQPPSAERGS